MEPIESASDVGRAVESSGEAPQLKRKDTDHPPQRPESPAGPEHLALSRSPETFLDVLAGKCVNTGPASQLLNDDDAMVEELTVKNYMSPGLCISGSPSGGSGGGESSVRRGMWQNFRRIAAGGPRDAVPKGSLMGSRGDVGTSFSPRPRAPPPPFTQLGSSYANVSEHFHGNEKHTLSHSAPTSMPAGIRMKTLPASGFPQYTVKSNLKGKGIEYRHQETHGSPGIVMRGRHNERSNEKADVPPNLLHRPGLKADGKALFCGGGDSRISDAHCNGINLREWLKQRHHKFNKPERLHIFRQILELVDITHSQGLALQHLRPSYFMLSPINQIKYIGSLVPEGQLMTGLTDQNVHYIEHPLKMKRNLEQEKETHLSAKCQRHGEHSQLGFRHNMFPWKGELKGDTVEEFDASCFRNRKSENDYRMQQKFGEKYYTSNMSQSPPVSNFGFQLSKPEFRKLEERWYASPEELNERLCSLSTNIYNLGVLLFEV